MTREKIVNLTGNDITLLETTGGHRDDPGAKTPLRFISSEKSFAW